jgi:hypothetical protein
MIAVIAVLAIVVLIKIFKHHENRYEKLAYDVTIALQNNDVDASEVSERRDCDARHARDRRARRRPARTAGQTQECEGNDAVRLTRPACTNSTSRSTRDAFTRRSKSTRTTRSFASSTTRFRSSAEPRSSRRRLRTFVPPPSACAASRIARPSSHRERSTSGPVRGVSQVREPAAHGCLQVSRRLQSARAARRGRAARRRGRVFEREPRARRRAVGANCSGIPATIVMPSDAPAAKIAATRGYGAEIVRTSARR